MLLILMTCSLKMCVRTVLVQYCIVPSLPVQMYVQTILRFVSHLPNPPLVDYTSQARVSKEITLSCPIHKESTCFVTV